MPGAITGKNHLELVAHPRAAYLAREHVRRVLLSWGCEHLADNAQLVVSELVSNALTATGHDVVAPANDVTCAAADHIWIDLYKGSASMVLEVWDASPESPRIRTPAPDEEGGRGLPLVDALSRRWGYRWPASGGKIVWCVLGLEPQDGQQDGGRGEHATGDDRPGQRVTVQQDGERRDSQGALGRPRHCRRLQQQRRERHPVPPAF